MLKKILPFLLLFVFIGCLEYHEEMWLEKDGSGKLNFKIGLAEFIAMLDNLGDDDEDIFDRKKITDELNSIEGIEVLSSDSYYKNGRKWVEIELTFDSVENLSNLQNMEEGPALVGDIYWEKNEKGKFGFFRTVKTDISSSSDDNTDNENQTVEILKQYEWSYIVHFPGKVIETDDTGEITDKTTVTWTFPLTDIGEDGIKMSAVIR